ncbi:52 kda repressor of the inhibitor of the protein kinase [Plakobranchus ocellatus]|uniref:52 kDa repressor of the inhibitor of the protein kinase n=1 Tax=Plakobranchus ocellatus TaxID=259542 RepID=A0AAV4CJD0_9GAST|nr:52 kda repressor of the inhibitor of the protein kinase [Plakobranchus ocellatus]
MPASVDVQDSAPETNRESDRSTPRLKRAKGELCSAINCRHSRQHNPDLSFFRFPKDPERSKQWLLNSGRLDLLEGPRKRTPKQLYNSRVFCSDHFEDCEFTNPATRSRLKRDMAIPTLFDIPNPSKETNNNRPPPPKRTYDSLQRICLSPKTKQLKLKVAAQKEKSLLQRQETGITKLCSMLGDIGGTVASESALRALGTLLSQVRALQLTPWPDRGPESLRSPCCGLAVFKTI